MDVPQVDVFMSDLHHALSVDVQVGTGQEKDIETLWGKGMGKQVLGWLVRFWKMYFVSVK